MPLVGIAAHKTHGFLGIADRYFVVAVGHTVFQDDDGYALTIEKRCPVGSLVLHSEETVATARTDDHGAACGFLGIGQEYRHLGSVGGVAIVVGRTLGP